MQAWIKQILQVVTFGTTKQVQDNYSYTNKSLRGTEKQIRLSTNDHFRDDAYSLSGQAGLGRWTSYCQQ